MALFYYVQEAMELVTSQNGSGSNSVVPTADYVPAASPVKDINDDYDIKEVHSFQPSTS